MVNFLIPKRLGTLDMDEVATWLENKHSVNGALLLSDIHANWHALATVLLNALDFSSRALYLMPDNLRNKPMDLLTRTDLIAENFNDDNLRRGPDDRHRWK